jgi:ComF family protein
LSDRGFEGSAETLCLDCGSGPYALDATRAVGPYEGALRLAHHAFKFEGMEHLAWILGDRMAPLLPSLGPAEALVPVPVRPERERERGYHPARLLAEAVGRRASLPVLDALRKVRSTPAQVSLDEKERLRNLRGAFEVEGKAAVHRRLILVDDVYTTGGTLEECAGTLKRSGVGWVGALVLGRTPRLRR